MFLCSVGLCCARVARGAREPGEGCSDPTIMLRMPRDMQRGRQSEAMQGYPNWHRKMRTYISHRTGGRANTRVPTPVAGWTASLVHNVVFLITVAVSSIYKHTKLIHVHISRVMPAFLWRDNTLSTATVFLFSTSVLSMPSQFPSQAGLVFFHCALFSWCPFFFVFLSECNGHKKKKK